MLQELIFGACIAIIMLFVLYLVIKWAVKNGIKEAYRDITGKKLTKDLELETLLGEKKEEK